MSTNCLDYYEKNYDGSSCGLSRYCSNFAKRVKLVPSNLVVATLMACIFIGEFLATFQLLPLVPENEYKIMLDWTKYTYLALLIIKTTDLAWLVFFDWDST